MWLVDCWDIFYAVSKLTAMNSFFLLVASLTLRLHDRRTATMTRSTTNLWQDNLLKHSARVNLDLNAIREVKRGLELGRLLKLSADTCFNYLRMTDFLVAGKTVRPLSHVE